MQGKMKSRELDHHVTQVKTVFKFIIYSEECLEKKNAIIDSRVSSETYKLIEKSLTQNNARK